MVLDEVEAVAARTGTSPVSTGLAYLDTRPDAG